MRVALSWSGGKDGALALGRLLDAGHDVTLVHLTDAATRRDRAHGVPDLLVEEQAAALGLPLWLGASDVRGYEAEMLRALKEVDAEAFATGDIDFPPHRAWAEALAKKAGVALLVPLWGVATLEVAREAAATLRAFVCACRPPLDDAFLGRFVDDALLADVASRGADPAGERGEYHTFVVDGPRFRRRVQVMAADIAPHDGGWRLDLGLRGC